MNLDYSIRELCEAMAVSRSGYHDWAARVPGPRAQANAALQPLALRWRQNLEEIRGSRLRVRYTTWSRIGHGALLPALRCSRRARWIASGEALGAVGV